MRDSIYDSVKLIGAASVISNVSGSSAVTGGGLDTLGMTDAALRVCVGIPTGSPTGASFVVALQESKDNGATVAYTAALDNTGAAIGFTLTLLVGATGNTTTGSNQVVSMSSVAGLNVGALVTGTGIPAGTVVTAISGTTLTLSANATATNTATTLSFSGDAEARIEGLGINRQRFLRAVVTPTFTGGTSPAAPVIAEIVQGGPAQQLPANTTTSNT
jgi:hypothetical protein